SDRRGAIELPQPARIATRKPSSVVRGFVRRFLRIHSETPVSTALTWMVMALCAIGVTLTIAFVVLIVRGVNVHVDGPGVAVDSGHHSGESRGAGGSPHPAPNSSIPDAGTVARLTRAVNCRWSKGSRAPNAGDDLAVGRKLELRSGLAEIIY